ncbi:MAG TPA: class I SAM-dependent methyltransferase [Niabella sp.]|nr:class I SAM-dependent methyltransferase [Niabella sp.]HOZ97352.1 class I SAM-dependent methyltransferase [Niabella sp.]HQW15377.1 class I SAM-dependent methyltransferase [Niabella sp.]HQX20577.1 class I SAM-dependent methyltransferase [Niabella sp.]HQX40962.1 class I SAM-dependent methyltransferase [Niabella sp.]
MSEKKFIYERNFALSEDDLIIEHRKIAQWIGEKKTVLEVACNTGYFSSYLLRKDCQVTGVELDSEALHKAKPYLVRDINGSIEDESIWKKIETTTYDVVLFMHILEHLTKPEIVLRRALNWVKDDGFLVICLPNINNWNDRWKIFKGNFNYTETGVMDKTHLKFYNHQTAQELIKDAGLDIEEYFGGSQKVRFKIVPSVTIIGRLNILLNKFAYKYFPPNITDEVMVFKVKKK